MHQLAFIISPEALIALAPIAFVFGVLYVNYSGKSLSVGIKIVDSNSDVLKVLTSIITRIRLIKISSKEEDEKRQIQEKLIDQARLYTQATLLQLKLSYAAEFIGIVVLGGFIYTTTQLLGHSFASTAALTATFYRLVPRIKEFLSTSQSIESYVGSVKQVIKRKLSIDASRQIRSGKSQFQEHSIV